MSHPTSHEMKSGSVAGRGEVRMLSGTAFESHVLNGQGPIAVEFMSYGCAHCRALEPVLQNVAAMLAAEETFYRVNVAVDEELANTYGIRGTPTLVLFRGGEEVGRSEGPRPSPTTLLKVVADGFAA